MFVLFIRVLFSNEPLQAFVSLFSSFQVGKKTLVEKKKRIGFEPAIFELKVSVQQLSNSNGSMG